MLHKSLTDTAFLTNKNYNSGKGKRGIIQSLNLLLMSTEKKGKSRKT